MKHEKSLEFYIKKYTIANDNKQKWKSYWEDCYKFALPSKSELAFENSSLIYDATACDCSENLASSLSSALTPTWGRWFSADLLIPEDQQDKETLNKLNNEISSEKIEKTLSSHFLYSNFSLEIHQAYLDLVVAGTAVMMFEENDPGESSAFSFRTLPLKDVVLEENSKGLINNLYYACEFSYDQLREQWRDYVIDDDLKEKCLQDPSLRFSLLQAIGELENGAYEVLTILRSDPCGDLDEPYLLSRKVLNSCPFIAFRWLKASGEVYGRSPIMKVLPDIKTLNKAVELTLKNASLAVTGIWLADDDGVLNPSTVRLVPGAIIPKAIGSSGLTPLKSAGNFDVSQLIISDLRTRIKEALLVNYFSSNTVAQTATEVLQKSSDISRILGATFARLQTELLMPLLKRAWDILEKRGEVPTLSYGHHDLERVSISLSPVTVGSQEWKKNKARDILLWLSSVSSLGVKIHDVMDINKIVDNLAESYGVDKQFILANTDSGQTDTNPSDNNPSDNNQANTNQQDNNPSDSNGLHRVAQSSGSQGTPQTVGAFNGSRT